MAPPSPRDSLPRLCRLRLLLLALGAWEPAWAAPLAPGLCASDVLHQVDNIIGLANGITQASVDCTLPGLNEKSCASDLLGTIAQTSGVAGLFVDMTMTCGDLD